MKFMKTSLTILVLFMFMFSMGVVTLGDSDDVDDSDDREKTKNPRRAVGRDTPHLSPAGGRVIARNVRDVRDANKDEFKEMYKNKISAGVDKCAEKDDEESKEKKVVKV